MQAERLWKIDAWQPANFSQSQSVRINYINKRNIISQDLDDIVNQVLFEGQDTFEVLAVVGYVW